MRPYLQMPIGFVENLTPLHWLIIAVGGASAAVLLVWLRRRHTSPPAWLPIGIVLVVALGAGYAYFLRQPGGLLAPHDAYALRSFTANYFTPYLLAAAVVGFALVVPRVFWTHTWMVLLVTVFCAFFFYKIRIVPEHFWVARRFLPVILPGMLLFAGAAFFAPCDDAERRAGRFGPVESAPAGARPAHAIGVVVIGLAGVAVLPADQARAGARRVRRHHPAPRGAGRADPRRRPRASSSPAAGRTSTCSALPLAYIYAKNVLVLGTDEPAPADVGDAVRLGFAALRPRALHGQRRVEAAEPVASTREFVRSETIWVPEYERSPDRVPTESRTEVVRLQPLPPRAAEGAASRVARGRGRRPTNSRSAASIRASRTATASSAGRRRTPSSGCGSRRTAPSKVIVWMGNGGRPASAPSGHGRGVRGAVVPRLR